MHVEPVPADKMSLDNMLKQMVFCLVHLSCLFVFITGYSWFAVGICVLMYVIRMFAITGGYHRYFSHRTYQTSRVFQFLLAFLGAMSGQKGPIWWASHHRHHHQHSDTEEDMHSAKLYGVWYSHVGWILSSRFVSTRFELVKDLLKFPELRLIDKYNALPPTLLAISLYFFGAFCHAYFPALHTTGFQMLVWGFFISTVFLYHGTFVINSFCHMIGKQRFKTGDESRNNIVLALITLGEGWHNNHHRYPGSERQGFYWWEIDISHYILKFLEKIGLVWELRTPPERIYSEAVEHPV